MAGRTTKRVLTILINSRDKTKPGLDSVKKNLDGVSRSLKQIQRVIIATAATLATSFLFRKMTDSVQGFLEAASKAQETLNKWHVLLGDQAPVADKFINELSRVGRSTTELRDNFSTLFSFFEGAGFDRDISEQLSEAITQRAVDFASVFDQPDEIAQQRFTAGLAGMALPLRRYGIDITQAAVRQKVLSLGMTVTTDNMSTQQKMMARLLIMMERSSKTAQDAANTYGSWANQMKALSAQWFDFRKEIGLTLIPMLLPFVKLLRERVMPQLKVLILRLLPRLRDIAVKLAPLFHAFGLAVRESFNLLGHFVNVGLNAFGIQLDDIQRFMSKMVTKLTTWLVMLSQFIKQLATSGSTARQLLGATLELFWDQMFNRAKFFFLTQIPNLIRLGLQELARIFPKMSSLLESLFSVESVTTALVSRTGLADKAKQLATDRAALGFSEKLTTSLKKRSDVMKILQKRIQEQGNLEELRTRRQVLRDKVSGRKNLDFLIPGIPGITVPNAINRPIAELNKQIKVLDEQIKNFDSALVSRLEDKVSALKRANVSDLRTAGIDPNKYLGILSRENTLIEKRAALAKMIQSKGIGGILDRMEKTFQASPKTLSLIDKVRELANLFGKEIKPAMLDFESVWKNIVKAMFPALSLIIEAFDKIKFENLLKALPRKVKGPKVGGRGGVDRTAAQFESARFLTGVIQKARDKSAQQLGSLIDLAKDRNEVLNKIANVQPTIGAGI